MDAAERYSVILQHWPMSSVRSIRPIPSHMAQDRREVGEQFWVELLVAALPEVLVVTQSGVVGREARREFGGDALLRAVAGPGLPLGGVVVEVLVHAGRDAVGVAGVLAHHAFVVECDHHPRQFPTRIGSRFLL